MGNGLRMNISAVNSISKDIARTNNLIAKEFTSIDSAMTALGDSWNDTVGSDFTAQFSAFIDKSSEINDLLKAIKSDIDKKVSKASNAYNNAIRSMMG